MVQHSVPIAYSHDHITLVITHSHTHQLSTVQWLRLTTTSDLCKLINVCFTVFIPVSPIIVQLSLIYVIDEVIYM